MKHDECGVMFQNGVCCCGCGRTHMEITTAAKYQPRWRKLIRTRWFTLLLATRGRK